MNCLNARKHLLGDHDDCLDREPPATVIKEVLERGAKQVDHQDIVQTFLAKVVDIRNAGWMITVSRVFDLDRAEEARVILRQPTRILYVRYSSRS